MAETPIGPKSFTFGAKAPQSQARPQLEATATRGGVEGGGGGLTAYAQGGDFNRQAAINQDEMNSLLAVVNERLKPRMDRLQKEQAAFGAMRYGSGQKLKEIVDKQPWFSKIFGDTYVVEGARQFAVVTEHQNLMNQIARDMPELRKLSPEQMQQEIVNRISQLETGDPTADALLQTQSLNSLPDISRLYTAENIAWTQSEMKRNQFNAIRATGDRIRTLSDSLKNGTITPEEFQQQADRELGGIMAPVDGQTDESYRENISAAAQAFITDGNYHAVNAMQRAGVLDGLSPEDRNRADAIIQNGKPQAVGKWVDDNQEEMTTMNIAFQRAVASGNMDMAKEIIRAANGRIMLETGVDYNYFDEAKSLTQMQITLDTNRAKVQEAEVKSKYAVEAGLIQAEAATLVGKNDAESVSKLGELLQRADRLNQRYRDESGDATAEYIDMQQMAKTGAVTITNLGLQRDKDIAQAQKEREKEDREAQRNAVVSAATRTAVQMGNGSKILGIEGQTEDIRNIAFQQVFDAAPDNASKINILVRNYASADEVNSGVQNRLQMPLKLATQGGRWNDSLVPTIEFYQQMVATPGGGAAAEAYFGPQQAKTIRNYLAVRANVADPAIAWEMAANAPPPMPNMGKEATARVNSAIDKYMSPGFWARTFGGQTEVSPAAAQVMRDHVVRQVAVIQAGNPSISDDQAIGMAIGNFKQSGGEYAGRYAWYRDPSQSPDISTIIGRGNAAGEADIRYDRNTFGRTLDNTIKEEMGKRGVDYEQSGITIIPGDDFGMDTLFTIVVTGERNGQPITAPIQMTLGELNQRYRRTAVPATATQPAVDPAASQGIPGGASVRSFGRNTN